MATVGAPAGGLWRYVTVGVDLVVASALGAAVTVDLATTTPPPDSPFRHPGPPAYVLGLLLTLPVAARRWFPRTVLLVTLSALLFCAVLGVPEVYPGVGVGIAAYTVATRYDTRTTVAAGVAVLVVTVVTKLLLPVSSLSSWVVDALVFGGAWILGAAARAQRERTVRIADHAARLEQEREQRAEQAVADERARIAREMHDVVSHSLSVIAVQSGVAGHLLDTRPSQARQAVHAIEETSRSALQEMRRLLAVLRPDHDATGPLSPAPSLRDLPQLVDRVRDGGVDARLVVCGHSRPLPASVELTLYRVAQEALTNVLRHAGPVTATVALHYGEEDVELQVCDDGPATPDRPRATQPGDGRGLIGLRERVSLTGGTFEYGRRPHGGFSVDARVPVQGGS